MNAEQSAFVRDMYRDMYNQLKGYAYSTLKNESQSEEAVQEAFQIACQKPEDLMNSPNPRGWMKNTVKFTAANIRHGNDRDKRILAEFLASQSSQIAMMEDRISLEVDYANIAHLEEYRLLEDKVLKGKTHLEIAEERGITLVACKKRVQRAKEILRKKLK